ncbi:beta-lactamase/transpeptidase-like protein [Hypoxylon fuscum]|nr:beta-lactamase/transpeptidase-like protein [Hypoxylon fuscum]
MRPTQHLLKAFPSPVVFLNDSAVSTLKETIGELTGYFNGTAVPIGVKPLHETTHSRHTLYAASARPKGSLPDRCVDRLPNRQRDDITLQTLTSHMGGIGSDCSCQVPTGDAWTELGLPKHREVLGCVVFSGIPPCNATGTHTFELKFWDNFGKRDPYSNPLYSNTAFFMLSQVVELVSRSSYIDFVKQHVLDPVGMTKTSYTKPNDDMGAISLDDTIWDSTLGIEDSAGGFYSSTEDMLTFGDGILTNKLPFPTKTCRWLKPVTFTSSSSRFIVEFYTKGGDVGTYYAMLALITDYDLVGSVLFPRPETSSSVVQLLFSQITSSLLAAVETAGKDDASATFAGPYADEQSNSTLTLKVDNEGPGLSITDSLLEVHISIRLHPSSLTAGSEAAWRVAIDFGTPVEITKSMRS